jgi:hypothetical protein
MSDLGAPKTAPQFETAEYQPSGQDACRTCKQPIGTQYFRVNGAMTCPSCADQAQRAVPQAGGAEFMRAVLFGFGAALVGLALYATFEIMTGWMIGYVSLAVGWMIATAMMKGSGGVGGRRYQIAAAVLTYAAVSMAAIPVALHQYSTEKNQIQQAKDSNARQNTAEPNSPSGVAGSEPQAEGKKSVSPGFAIITLLGLGLASPFLELTSGASGVIGLVILFVGIRIAWRLTGGTRTLAVEGPYQVS